ncbi:MAG TPA: PKD domain-containing protein [Bacteroidia bacterium]|jgi:hypothetical protein
MSINTIKRFLFAFVFLFVLTLGKDAFAGKRYWVGTGANVNWNSTGNWSLTSGGASGAGVPGSLDSVYFNGGGTGQCSINATVVVRRFEMASGYTDTVKQNSNVITVGASGIILSAGVFQGGSAAITSSGIFTLSGCDFRSTSAAFTIVGNYTFSSGTFTHNNGEVKFTATSTINGNTSFYDLSFSPTGTSTFTISSGITLTVNHLLKTTGSAIIVINTGNIDAKGDIMLSNTYSSSGSSGTGTLTINGTTKQVLTGSASAGQGRLWNTIINKASDTLVLKNIVNVGGNWTYTAGIIDASTFTSTVCFSAFSKTISGKHSLYNVNFQSQFTTTTYTMVATDTLTIAGNLEISGVGVNVINTGVLNLKGNLLVSNTINNSASGGSATIYFSGTGNQTLDGAATDLVGRLCNIIIDKATGDLILKDKITMGPGRNWTLLQGTLDITAYDSELIFARTGSVLKGNQTLKNLTFNSEASGNSILTIPPADTITINGELRYEGATFYASIDSGHIHAKGDITIANTSANNYTPTSIIKICGSGTQTINGTASALQGRLPNVEIDKAGDTLVLKNFITMAIGCDWKLINGILDATTHASTLFFSRGTCAIEGSQTLNNLVLSAASGAGTYDIPAGDTITVQNELKTEGNNIVSINSGTIKAQGNINVTNGNVGTPVTNSGRIKICGPGTQTFTGSGIALSGKLCNIEIDKPTGILNLSNIITVDGDWNYMQGDVNPGSSTVVFYGGGYLSVNTVGSSASMSFNNISIYSTVIFNSPVTCLGGLTINSSSTINGNSQPITVGGDWTNISTGVFTYANTSVTLNGPGRQRMKSSGTLNFYDLIINKPSQKVLFDAPVIVNNNLTLTKGSVGTTSTNLLSMLDNKTCSGGSDSSYVCGPMKKTGNDAFTFPLGDTLLVTGAYHPLVITAPSVVSDAFTSQYYSINQGYGSALQTDSLSSISNCEYWLLTRNSGTSAVVPTLGWNANSCNADLCHKLRVASWNGTQWQSRGYAGITTSGSTGLINAASGYSASSLPLVIARTISSSLYPTVTAAFSGNDTVCSGDSTVLTASGASTYSWSPSTGLSATTGSSVTASPTVTTTYSVIGTNSHGCTDTVSLGLTVLSLPSLSVSPSVYSMSICDSSVTLNAYEASGYSWAPSTGLSSTTGSTVQASPTTNTTYTVSVTGSNGCTKTATAVVLVSGAVNLQLVGDGFMDFNEYAQISRSAPPIYSYSATACRDSAVTIGVTGCNNPSFIYSWNMGDSTILTGDSVSHTYTTLINDTIVLTVTDTSGATATYIKYIPITVYPCLPDCCPNPYLYVSDTISGLDTAINLSDNQTIFLCGNATYNFSTNCYRPDTTTISWVFSDTTYAANNIDLAVTSGSYSFTLITFGSDCDSTSTVITVQTLSCQGNCSDCLGSFSPVPAKKYLLSAWVKEDGAALTKTSYTYPEIIIASPSVAYTVSAGPAGRIIDGWQRVEQEFTLPSGATDLHIELKCTTGDCFFDDIRVYPFDGSMKSYVYDPVNMRLNAELDERNYATFYEYDEEGKLVRVKKETEKGIMTIKENRNKTKK